MARRTVEVTGLKQMARAFDKLARTEIGNAIQAGVNDTAKDALERLKPVFILLVEGGPVPFTEVKPGSKSSSVLADTFKKPFPDAARSSVRVQDRQAAYLKYLLGDDDIRKPGDVGVADSANFIAQPDLLRFQGIDVTDEGNLPRNSLKKLFSRAAKRKAAVVQGKKRRRVTPGGRNDIWYGTRQGGGKTTGFWQRPKDLGGKPVLLVNAVEQSDYAGQDRLVKGWNRAVTEAGDGMAASVEKRVSEAVRKARLP